MSALRSASRAAFPLAQAERQQQATRPPGPVWWYAVHFRQPGPGDHFKCSDTQALFQGKRVKRWVNIERPALRKLTQLDWSSVLDDLKVPPGNGLEALKNDRKGQHSIRINKQWRVCFVWTRDGAANVEIVDYH